MKKVICNILLVIMLFSFSSCLTGGLEELPEYEDANITSVSTVQYRYISDEISAASGQNIVKDVNLTYKSEIDIDAALVKISVTTPDNFPQAELDKLSKSNLLIAVGLSTAARISPTNGAPILGIPGDWSRANSYVVESASGKKKDWTIEVVSLEK